MGLFHTPNMNKIPVSKAAMQKANWLISVGYQGAQYLLRFKQPIAYSSGYEGWHCDYYDLGPVVLSTGYQPIGTPMDAIARQLDKEAKQIIDSNLDDETSSKAIDKLITKLKEAYFKQR